MDIAKNNKIYAKNNDLDRTLWLECTGTIILSTNIHLHVL